MGTPDIESILREKLRRAELTFRTAQDKFRDATSDVPSGLPHPDGTGRVKAAGTSYRSA